MKKILLTLSACAALGTISAQQIANSDFSGAWVDCTPWTSSNSTVVTGTNPEGWTISHVSGINGLGATVVGSKGQSVDGDSTGVKIYNSPNSLMATQIVPGYLTLGTTWSTAASMGNSNKDGGTFGGINFAFKPDAVAMKYKRAHAVDVANEKSPLNTDEPATVVAYLWKGTFSQADVPGNIALFGSANKVTMVDRDRNILGIQTSEGGEVTKTDDAELIGKLNYSILGDTDEWTDFIQPIEYLSDATPEKFNIIIAANDYFGGADVVGCGNTLEIDDVNLVYYSRLASFQIGGQEIPGFDSEVYEYDLRFPAGDDATQIMSSMYYPVMGQSAVAIPGFDPATFTATIKVMNPAGADVDGATEHTYTFHIIIEDTKLESLVYEGSIDIDMFGDITSLGQQALNIIDIKDNLCTLALYHFDLGDNTDIGDIIIENVTIEKANGVTTYKGAKKGLSLAEGSIIADVECEGTVDDLGNITMNIDVNWIMDTDEDGNPSYMPIKVVFKGSGTSAINDITTEDVPAEYYNLNGVKVADPTPGIYIMVKGGKATKVIVR